MRNVTTVAIVLKRHNLGEADRLLTLFTKELGKVSAIAKGARKPKSKFGSHLEPGNVIQFDLAQGKTFYVVTAGKTDQYFRYEQMDTMQALFIWLEIIDQVIHQGEVNKPVFELAIKGLDAINKLPDTVGQAALIELELYSTIGYQLTLDKCIIGREVLKQDSNAISMRAGGVVCSFHRSHTPDAMPISVSAIKILRLIEQQQFETLQKITMDQPLQKELKAIATLQRHEIIEKRLKSEQL